MSGQTVFDQEHIASDTNDSNGDIEDEFRNLIHGVISRFKR